MDLKPEEVERLIRRMADESQEHAIMLLDTSGHIQWWSRGAERIFGMSKEHVHQRHFSLLFTREDVESGIADHEMRTAKAEGSAENDRWLVRVDGSRFWANGALVALHNERNELVGFGKILRDRLDVKEQLQTLRNQFDAAQAVSKRKDVFLSTLSHELRNPLAPLTNAVHLIRMTAPPDADLEYPLRIIERQVASIARLVDDLLDISRISAGKIELHRTVLSLETVVKAAVDNMGPALTERKQSIDVLFPPTPLLVFGDHERLIQVFVNLINNAVKYTPPEGHIAVKATTEGDEAVVHVQDNGIGIAHDMLPRIFELFTQVESSRSASQGGLGIGLALVKDLVGLHGGSVQVRSEGPGKGSEFSVRLPLHNVDSNPFSPA
jgi:PAS domain S-box-containing protein